MSNERGAVQAARQRGGASGWRLVPRQCVRVQDPQVAQAAAGHAAVDHQTKNFKKTVKISKKTRYEI